MPRSTRRLSVVSPVISGHVAGSAEGDACTRRPARSSAVTIAPSRVTVSEGRGRERGRLYAIGWCGLALASAAGAGLSQPRLAPLVVTYAIAIVVHVRCRPDDVESVTRSELAVIFLGISGALLSAALLTPELALAAPAAAALVALELRLAVQPQGTPAA